MDKTVQTEPGGKIRDRLYINRQRHTLDTHHQVEETIIDEEGTHRIRGTNDSDHNTILTTFLERLFRGGGGGICIGFMTQNIAGNILWPSSIYFLNAPIELCKKCSTPSKDPCEYLNHNITKSLYMGPSTEEEIMKILLNIKNSYPGHDDINIKVRKAVKEYIIAPLTQLCNIYLITGKVPNELKIAKVIPIHKKGKQNELGNYRPVSVLPAFSKVYERLVYRIFKFIDDHNILFIPNL